jgi:hypothetical protein
MRKGGPGSGRYPAGSGGDNSGGSFDSSIDGARIGKYTSYAHEEIVAAQLGKSMKSYSSMTAKEALTAAKELEDSLLKLKGWTGQSYRGIKFNSSSEQKEFLDNVKRSGQVKFKAFQSTTSSETVANSFMGTNKLGVKLVIDGKSGRDVKEFSRNKNENEVLFMKNSNFEVSRIDKNTVYLKEI